ncbi:MAG: hypothetical protein AABW91_03605 [Nanoarchaeota archaeon]
MKNFHKTLLFTIILCLITIITTSFVQLKANDILENSCSYFDPVMVDILAFLLAIFLISEGSYRVYEHANFSLKKQITRSIRIACGFGILTLHVIQFFYKGI